MTASDIDDAREQHRRGDYAGAVTSYRHALSREPGNVEIMRLLGIAALQAGDVRTADDSLTRALETTPGSMQLRCDLGKVRLAQRRFREARDLLDGVLRDQPNHPDDLNNCALACVEMAHVEPAAVLFERLTHVRPRSSAAHRHLGDTRYKLGQTEDAVDSLRRAIEIDPEDRQARLVLGDALESMGRWREARAQYLAILRRSPDSPLALARLLMLRGEEPEPRWLAAAEMIAVSGKVRPEPRARVGLALAHYHDRRADYDQAFRHLERSNALLRALRPYDADRFGEAVDRLIDVFSASTVTALAGRPGSDTTRPIFILGMPRSGTTLVEQILASHSQVEAGGELSAMLNVAARIQAVARTPRPYPHSILEADANAFPQLAGYYLRRLDRVSADARHVKLPFNFMHVGLIATLFPRAIVIHCQRDPLDTCLSCFFTSFSEQIRFAHDLASVGTYFGHYRRLMEHWGTVLPRRMLAVIYEELVRDPEATIPRLVAQCGLDWEDSCLAFHATERGVRTPSRWQVRQRISSSSIGSATMRPGCSRSGKRLGCRTSRRPTRWVSQRADQKNSGEK